MAKVWTLLLTLSISTIFLHLPSAGSIGFPLNDKYHLDYNQYFYLIGEHLVLITMALIIWDEAREHRNVLFVFVCIQIADAVTFMLSYSDPLENYLITFNILKIIIFGLAIGIELWNHSKGD